LKNTITIIVAFLILWNYAESQAINSFGMKIAFTSAVQEWNVAPGGKMNLKKRNGINFAAYV
jgi:hypothetical protein